MIVQLDQEKIKAEGLSLYEAILLLFFDYEKSEAQIIADLSRKGLIKRTSVQELVRTGLKHRLTEEGKTKLKAFLVNSEKPVDVEAEASRLSNLAKKLKEIFPKGRKEGTNTYWAEGQALIMKRLKLFFKKYDPKCEIYTDEDIIKAATSYVKSFNGDYRFMRVLKYFIFKEEKGADGMVESTSDLVNRIENAEEDSASQINWMDSIR